MENTKKKGKSEQEIDRISNLPNSIQSLIVSFLPIEDGIRTRILSKNWRHVCASFSNLNFNEYEYRSNNHNIKLFEDLVDQTLRFHDGSALHKFNLDIANFSTPLILEWISFVLHRNVQQLVLHFYPEKLDKLPPDLFTCPTLTLLSLSRVHLRLPTSFQFPVLKSLTLHSVRIYGDKPLDQLIPSCPVLEKLRITLCSWENRVVLNITTSTLKELMLSVPDITTHGAIKISAANLHTISYEGNPPDISPESFTSMHTASFYFSFPFSSCNSVLDTLCHRANIIFRGKHNFGNLTLSGLVFEYLSRIPDLFSCPLTSCLGLKDLTLCTCCSGDYVYAILFLLKNCPNLQYFEIIIQEKSTSSDMFNLEQYSESQELAAGSNLKHLKIVRIDSFEGSQGELDLAKYLLENADVMEEMKINFSNEVKEDESKSNISQKILVLTKASPHAVISFW